MINFWDGKRVLVTGGAGFLGTNVVKQISLRGAPDFIKTPRSKFCDLRRWDECKHAVKDCDIIIHLAAKVGGIGYNQNNPGQLFYDNAVMGIQIIEAARQEDVDKVVVVGTICAYPKFTPTPFKEEDLWNGYPEETNAPYGLAKKMLLVQAQAYRKQYGMNIIYLLPVNLYGIGDNFNPEESHVIPALIKKFIDAKNNNYPFVVLWGSGTATREFVYVEDAANGIILATERYNKPDPINLGSGNEISILNLAKIIQNITGYDGEIIWDTQQPDGQPCRRLDISKAEKEFGFIARTPFQKGLELTIEWYLK